MNLKAFADVCKKKCKNSLLENPFSIPFTHNIIPNNYSEKVSTVHDEEEYICNRDGAGPINKPSSVS